jgi:predicted patatin/cPLA2 family phospholipase
MSLPFRTLGLGGGGMKGIMYIGALRELSQRQDLVFPDGVYGVSIGAIVGTYIAFGLPLDLSVEKAFKMSAFIPEPDFSNLPEMITLKGVFSMDTLKESITNMFLSKGVDLRTKVIGDAKMPLYILASNLTKGKPTIFSKNVPVLDALMSSCCIPGIFRPQVLYDQVYVDGDLFVPSIDKFIPDAQSALCLSLKKQKMVNTFRPETIETMSPISYVHDMYSMVTQNFFMQVKKPCTLQLTYPNLMSTSDLSKFDVPDILSKAASELSAFLRSKSFREERPEVLD